MNADNFMISAAEETDLETLHADNIMFSAAKLRLF